MRLGLSKPDLLAFFFEFNLCEVVILHELKKVFQLLDVLREIHSKLARSQTQPFRGGFVISIYFKVCYTSRKRANSRQQQEDCQGNSDSWGPVKPTENPLKPA